MKITKHTTKAILREAFNGVVPDHVINRRKLGFPVPIRHWLKDELHDWAKKIILESNTDDIICKKYVLDLFQKHQLGVADYSRKLWTILVFMIWHKIFVEKQLPDSIEKLGKHVRDDDDIVEEHRSIS
jgi:asparagine synthase (glutamine-hydrolysing)